MPRSYRGRGKRLSRDAEKLASFPHRRDERVDVVHAVIDIKGRPRSRRDAQSAHQRLCAMMTRANADPVAIEDRRQIVWMNVAVREWNDAGPMVAWSVDGHALDLREPLNGDPGKRGLVLGNTVHPQLLQIRDRSTEAHRRFDVRGPTLELVRDLVPGRVVVPDSL